MIDVNTITELHRTCVARWHQQPIDNPYQGFLHIVCEQHSQNFLLWHEEDRARAQDVDDSVIAQVKRNIDKYNQQRNDLIEKLDDAIRELVTAGNCPVGREAPLNTETPGSAIDRLSVSALRCYHLREQCDRDDVTDEQRQSVERKISICTLQQTELQKSLQELLNDIFAGRRRHRTYRQLKMYNDPSLNPHLYRSKSGALG
jgi:hypothetical protein